MQIEKVELEHDEVDLLMALLAVHGENRECAEEYQYIMDNGPENFTPARLENRRDLIIQKLTKLADKLEKAYDKFY